MSSSLHENNESSAVPLFVLYQELILRIKQRLSLANLESSFVSKNKIIEYIKLLHDENEQIRKALDPPSLEDEIVELRAKCSALREQVSKKETDIWKLGDQLHKLDQDLHFMEQHCQKEQEQCDLIESQIKAMVELCFVDRSVPQPEQVSFLMDNFFQYFEEQRVPEKSQQKYKQMLLLQNSARFGQELSEKSRTISKVQNKTIEMGEISQIDLQKITFTGQEEIQYLKKE